MSAQLATREPVSSSEADGELACTSANGLEAARSSLGNVQSFLESVTPFVHFRDCQGTVPPLLCSLGIFPQP